MPLRLCSESIFSWYETVALASLPPPSCLASLFLFTCVKLNWSWRGALVAVFSDVLWASDLLLRSGVLCRFAAGGWPWGRGIWARKWLRNLALIKSAKFSSPFLPWFCCGLLAVEWRDALLGKNGLGARGASKNVAAVATYSLLAPVKL